MVHVTIRYWAAAREAAGVSEESVNAATVAEALRAVRDKRNGDLRFENVLASSSYLIGDVPVGLRDRETIRLSKGAVIEVLPPFAGG